MFSSSSARTRVLSGVRKSPPSSVGPGAADSGDFANENSAPSRPIPAASAASLSISPKPSPKPNPSGVLFVRLCFGATAPKLPASAPPRSPGASRARGRFASAKRFATPRLAPALAPPFTEFPRELAGDKDIPRAMIFLRESASIFPRWLRNPSASASSSASRSSRRAAASSSSTSAESFWNAGW